MTARRKVLLAALLALLVSGGALAQQAAASAEQVRDVLVSSVKWTFASTTRLPLDPIDSWNQYPAAVRRSGDALGLEVSTAYKDTSVAYAMTLQADGFAFENPGIGSVFMRFDAADAKAPFKGQIGNRTYWLLRSP